jgi:hypothetical protein
MAEVMKTTSKPTHPPFSRMVCDAMHAMDKEAMGKDHHGHSMHSLKKFIGEHYKVGNGWEKRVNSTVNMMIKKKQLAHAAGHMGSFRLSKSMAAREEKRLKRGMKAADKAPKAAKVPKAKAAPKRKAAKMEGPAKRAKKASPKKMPAKKE